MKHVMWAGVMGVALLIVSDPGAEAARRGGEGQYRAVESRIFDAVKYDGSTRTLTLVFDSGAAYAYLEVPRAVYDDFVRIVNKGEYFNRHIKRAYVMRRLNAYPASWCARD